MDIFNIIVGAIVGGGITLIFGPALAWGQEDRRLDRHTRSGLSCAVRHFKCQMEREEALRRINRGCLSPNGFLRMLWPVVRAVENPDCAYTIATAGAGGSSNNDPFRVVIRGA